MYTKKSAKPPIIAIALISAIILCGGFFFVNRLNDEFNLYSSSKTLSVDFFEAYVPDPFINSGVSDTPRSMTVGRGDALYSFTAPEGFVILSHSVHWDEHMLELLYDELKLNTHGDEIDKLYEVIIHPYEDDNKIALATYAPGIASVEFVIRFPAFPDDFYVGFPVYTGRINLYGGDTNNTIESIAASLSHEYGHHYTFCYMFDDEMRSRGALDESRYGRLRSAGHYKLIPDVDVDRDEYLQQWHNYIIETAAEDFVMLMGSPTTRQVEDYYDIKQLVDDPDLPREIRGERNAFPQGNMAIPLAIDVPVLADYFYSFIDSEPPVPIEEKQTITLQISKHADQYDLSIGPYTYVYYTVSWNTPYQDAIYTLACFDTHDYSGWGYPIKTVRPGTRRIESASAVIGEYATRRGNTVFSMDDELAQGIKTFYVIAQLPDGTYYSSDFLEVNFG